MNMCLKKAFFVEKTPYFTIFRVSLQCLLHVTSDSDAPGNFSAVVWKGSKKISISPVCLIEKLGLPV